MKKLILLLLILPLFFACTDDTSSSSEPEPTPEPTPIEEPKGCDPACTNGYDCFDGECGCGAANNECYPGQICVNGSCRYPGCEANYECDGTKICNLESHTCEEPPAELGESCDATHLCGTGLICDCGICIKEKLPDDFTCVKDDDCRSGLCKDNKCSSN